jgi:hypothetical protein
MWALFPGFATMPYAPRKAFSSLNCSEFCSLVDAIRVVSSMNPWTATRGGYACSRGYVLYNKSIVRANHTFPQPRSVVAGTGATRPCDPRCAPAKPEHAHPFPPALPSPTIVSAVAPRARQAGPYS